MGKVVMMKQFISGFLAILLFMTVAVNAEASPQVIEAVGVAVMGDNDSPKAAKNAARKEAMRQAVEKAGVYVESYSKTQNMQLTADDVRVISGAVLKVTNERAVPELVNEVWRYTVYLTAEVDTANIDLQAMLAQRRQVEELQKERDELKRQNEELREKNKVSEVVKTETDEYMLGDAFDNCVGLIQQGKRMEAIRDLSKIIANVKVTDSPRAYAYYLRGRTYYELDSIDMALDDFAKAQKTPHSDSIYPIWRTHYYRGLIYYDKHKWRKSYDELKLAWEASDKSDKEIYRALQLSEDKLRSEEARRAENHVDWGDIIGGILASTMHRQ